MTEPESHELHPESSSAISTPVGELPAEAAESVEPAPQPWTAERVVEWNSYYDIYVVLGVLLLAFVASANKVSHSSIWHQLKLGEVIAAKAAPVTTDLFSFTEANRPWVNLPWLFEWGHALLYKAAYGVVPVDANDPTASAPRAEQFAVGALVALTALIRVLTVLVILQIRRAGPGLWWSAVCALIAPGSIYSPLGVLLGGVAGPARVDPDTWGQLFFAVELLLLHKAINLGKRNAIWGLLPLFLLWANVDESFLVGLFVLAATVIGRLVLPRTSETENLSVGSAIAVLVASIAVCLANPSFYRIYGAAFEPLIQLFKPATGTLTIDQLSYFGKGIRESEPAETGMIWTYLIVYYFFAVGLGLASFVVNRHRFSLGRFLAFALLAVLWGVLLRYNTMFAVVMAAVLALNGQEWYQDRFGVRGKLGRGWAFWSTGGRFVTILVVFAFVAQCLTGYGRTVGEARFGFGFNPDDFRFEAAEYLRVLARLRALLRRTQPAYAADSGQLSFADLTLDPLAREVTRGTRTVRLTRTEFNLLELLMRHPRQVLTRSQILEEVWGFDFPTTANSLEVYVGYLRRKTEAEGEPRLIHTVRGIGYALRETAP